MFKVIVTTSLFWVLIITGLYFLGKEIMKDYVCDIKETKEQTL